MPEDSDSLLPEDCDPPLPKDHSPLLIIHMIKKSTIPSNTAAVESTTITSGMGVMVAPAVDDTLLETNLHSTHVTVIPLFIMTIQKKNKASIYSYLSGCQDIHFQKLL